MDSATSTSEFARTTDELGRFTGGLSNEELAEARWLRPAALRDLTTTEGLAEIVAAAFELLEQGPP